MAPYTRRRRVDVLRDPFAPGPPVPAAGCTECASWMSQWRQAVNPKSRAYDPSHASDLAVQIRRHPHDGRKEARG